MNYRCYHFGNMYLSSIQQGIQSAHAQMELFVKYQKDSKQKDMLYEWATNHKTMICLNGGFSSDLYNIKDTFKDIMNEYPWASFSESEEALGGTITNIAIILPERIYDTAEKIRKGMYILNYYNGSVTENINDNSMPVFGGYMPQPIMILDKVEMNIITILNSCKLAN